MKSDTFWRSHSGLLKRIFWAVTLFIALLLIAGIESSAVPTYGQICEKSTEATHKDCNTYSIVLVALWHIAKFLDDHGGAIGAIATVAISFYTFTLWNSTDKLWKEAVKSGKTAEQASQHTRDAYIADQRPWVSSDISLASGLKKDVNGITLTLRLVLKNTGKSPALNVWPSPEFFVASGDMVDPVGRQREIAERQKQQPVREGGFGFTLFPGDQIPIHVSITLNSADIEKFDTYISELGMKSFDFLPPIMILGCIDYKTVFDSQHHQTGFILDLYGADLHNPSLRKAIPKLTDQLPEVPIMELTLGYSFIGSGYTN